MTLIKDLQVMELARVVPEAPRTPPHHSVWKPKGERGVRAVTPLSLPSGIRT